MPKDAMGIVKRFNAIIKRNIGNKQHLSVTLSQLYVLNEDVENLFHKDELND